MLGGLGGVLLEFGINMLAHQILNGCCCMPACQTTFRINFLLDSQISCSFLCGVLSAAGYDRGGVVHFHGVQLWKDNPSGSGRRLFVRGFLALVNHEDGSVSGGLSVYKPAMDMLTCLEVREWEGGG